MRRAWEPAEKRLKTVRKFPEKKLVRRIPVTRQNKMAKRLQRKQMARLWLNVKKERRIPRQGQNRLRPADRIPEQDKILHRRRALVPDRMVLLIPE